tara:strand:- start:21230 stop:21628 length:399 start_codon:yes stop_codon:yes gene_type:complete
MTHRSRGAVCATNIHMHISDETKAETTFQIQVNTDHNIDGREALARHIKGTVASAMNRFGDEITRVEVHLSDENGHKFGQNDKHCVMEARLKGRQPTAVTHAAATINDAIAGSTEKLKRHVASTLAKRHAHS